jgi:hypothetical protein
MTGKGQRIGYMCFVPPAGPSATAMTEPRDGATRKAELDSL